MLHILNGIADRVFNNRTIANGALQAPQMSSLALLTLSTPASSVIIGDSEIFIMHFFDVFWVLEAESIITGFFPDEQAAIEYVQGRIEAH